MTTFNDGNIIRQSIQSILNQTHADLDLIIVDDGSTPETGEILKSFSDPRIHVIPQANDGLSSARNRALHHAKGDYICFLDADDIRAPWAFAEVADVIARTQAELVIVRGALSQSRSTILPFYDDAHFEGYEAECLKTGTSDLSTRKVWATTLEPQSANKFVSRALLERAVLRFPNDHFFEDILFHTLAIAHARSIELVSSCNFTYFQRQMRPQITASINMSRFDIIGTAHITFQMLEQHPDFANVRQRGALSIAALRLLRWCESCVPAYHLHAFRLTLKQMLRDINPLFLVIDPSAPDPRQERAELTRFVREALS